VPEQAIDVRVMMRAVPHNVTTEMDLTLWETAQAIRADPDSLARFRVCKASALADDYLLGRLPPAAQGAIAAFMERYGMRGLAEIDLGRPRWREEPLPVLQTLRSYLEISGDDRAPDAVYDRGRQAAEAEVERLIAALRRTRGGRVKARLARAAARRMRALIGLREAPKFAVVRLLGLMRQALLVDGARWVAEGLLAQPEDVYALRLRELEALAESQEQAWAALARERRQSLAREKQRRQIPRLLLSDGQAFYEGASGQAGDDRTLRGDPVSPGVVEGPVRVVRDPRRAQLAPGEILVCPGTDPSWTPLFLTAGGLVMEVGGMMTHGAVVAREYGLPAVVGVHEATRRLRTGQRVRVDGSGGEVVLLDEG
jgi:pyruvate,water dikinase